jgi:hypothetical protein
MLGMRETKKTMSGESSVHFQNTVVKIQLHDVRCHKFLILRISLLLPL